MNEPIQLTIERFEMVLAGELDLRSGIFDCPLYLAEGAD